jgi:hypothetical protein
MSPLALKALAAGITLAAVCGAAAFVGGHPRNPSAPQQPPVSGQPAGGSVGLSPSVHASDVEPVTSTYAS